VGGVIVPRIVPRGCAETTTAAVRIKVAISAVRTSDDRYSEIRRESKAFIQSSYFGDLAKGVSNLTTDELL